MGDLLAYVIIVLAGLTIIDGGASLGGGSRGRGGRSRRNRGYDDYL